VVNGDADAQTGPGVHLYLANRSMDHKQWMRRFNGVATSYPPNYLGWFRALDRNAQFGAKPSSLLTLALSS
jgi:hypothetical protein